LLRCPGEGCDVAEAEEIKARKSFGEALLRDMQGTAAEKLALFEKLKAGGGLPARIAPSVLKSRADATDVCSDGEVIDLSGRSRLATSTAREPP